MIALEREASPISIYDVQRAIARDLRREVLLATLTALIGTDRRFCWSGRGIYGLFRHDRIPGVRTLSGAARTLLAAYDNSLSVDELEFVLRWSGYRFQRVSLESALRRDADQLGFRFSWSGAPTWEPLVRVIGARDVRRSIVRDLARFDLEYGTWPAKALIDRWRDRVGAGLDERARRLAASL